jgi:cyanophycin synthetase
MLDSTLQTLDMSSKLLCEEALRRGVKCERIANTQALKMSRGGQEWFISGSRTSFQSSIGFWAAKQKALTKKFLSAANLPTAKFIEAKTVNDLLKARDLKFPVVMKPVAGMHGDDVITGISSFEKLVALFEKKPQAVIVEEMLRGTEYRVVCVDYKMVAVAYRKPAFVVGDGKKTVSELVAQKNEEEGRSDGHLSKLTKIVIDNEVEDVLNEQGLTLSSVVAKGQEVPLRRVVNLSQGGEAINVTEQVSLENRALFEAVARAMDLNVCGIDLMCEDLAAPIATQKNAGIIEINGSPGLRMHHFPSVGEPIDVASAIFDLIEKELAK